MATFRSFPQAPRSKRQLADDLQILGHLSTNPNHRRNNHLVGSDGSFLSTDEEEKTCSFRKIDDIENLKTKKTEHPTRHMSG